MTFRREAFDTETTGLDAHSSPPPRVFAYTRFDGKNYVRDREDAIGFKENLQAYLNDTSIAKVCHNVKFDYSVLLSNGYHIPEETEWHCTMIMHQLLDNINPSHSQENICYEIFGYPKNTDELMRSIARTVGGDYSKIPDEIMQEYQQHDAVRGKLMDDLFWPEIESDGKLLDVYRHEIELIKLTYRMEDRGIMIDRKECFAMIDWLDEEISKLQSDIYNLCGKYINPNSPKQLAGFLFDYLQFPIYDFTPSGNPKIDKHTIYTLQENGFNHPMLEYALKYRSYTNGKSTINKYLQYADKKTDTIHCNIKTNHDVTGRQAAEKPNFHNVQKEGALLIRYPIPARRCFRARPMHYWDLHDYSGIELRLIAALSGEQELIDCFKSGGDGHALLCQVWYDDVYSLHLHKQVVFSKMPLDSPERKTLRGSGKNGNFACGYGAQPKKLAQVFGLSMDDMKRSFDKIRERFPRYARFSTKLISQAKRDGFIVTPFGRRLKIPPEELFTKPGNFMIQGTGADILKRAQIRLGDYYRDQWNNKIKIILSIHDEIISEKPRRFLKHEDRLQRETSEIMTNFPEIDINLDVELKRTFGRWIDAK